MKNKVITNFTRAKNKIKSIYLYCAGGVWCDTKKSHLTDFIKIINLAVNSFLNKNIQEKSAALTYRTLLALIPALALIFAIGRGFGFQKILESSMFNFFPVQQESLQQIFKFIESYLAESSQGIFLGIGIIFLLWTLINLISNIEIAFNRVWGIRKGRSLYRKMSDYISIILIIPILMICETGISIFLSSSFHDSFFSPVINILLDIIPFIITWLVFAASFTLIPNIKVKFKYAIIPGILCGCAFQFLQWLFISGQIYVSKYNAIYGSFAFLPLLMIWLHLTWTITLAGVGLTYSAQNIFSFNFQKQIKLISNEYFYKIQLIIMTLIIKRFAEGKEPYSKIELSTEYEIPIRLLTKVIETLYDAGLIVAIQDVEDEEPEYVPACDINNITISYFNEMVNSKGESKFLKDFDNRFNNYFAKIDSIYDNSIKSSESLQILLKDL